MATDRILVHEHVAEHFVEIMKARLAKIATDGSALPAVVNAASKARLQKVLTDALAKGATVVCGSEKQNEIPGTAIVPTIVKDVDTSTAIWNEENFGPLVAITTVESAEHAVQIANSSAYGLSSSIFTRDLRKALALAKTIQSG